MKWKLIKKEVLHKDYWNSVNRNTYQLPNGKQVKDYIILDCRPVVMVFAITGDRKLVLIREYKPGSDKIVTQLPAGYIDDDETSEQAAPRELSEETVYVAKQFVKLGKIANNNGKTTAKVTGYLAENARKEKEQKLDEHEEIEIFTVTLEEAERMIGDGTIDSADSVAFILMAINKLKEKK